MKYKSSLFLICGALLLGCTPTAERSSSASNAQGLSGVWLFSCPHAEPNPIVFDVTASNGEIAASIGNPEKYIDGSPWLELQGKCDGNTCALEVLNYAKYIDGSPWLDCPKVDLTRSFMCMDRELSIDDKYQFECAIVR